MTFWQKWAPTNKWWVATVAAASTIAGMLVVGDGINTDDEKLVVIGLIAQRLVAYVARNEPETVVVEAHPVTRTKTS